MKKVSIIDVAKLAGVSVSTVSLVLRQKGKTRRWPASALRSVASWCYSNPRSANGRLWQRVAAADGDPAFAAADPVRQRE